MNNFPHLQISQFTAQNYGKLSLNSAQIIFIDVFLHQT